jgi:sugar phosphate isomerase/epimerase
MLQIKLGVELASLRLPLKKALLTARELGAEAVEIDARNELRPEDLSRTGVRQLRKMLDDLNLRVSAVTFRTRRGYHVPQELEARIDATKRTMQLAYDLGTNVVINTIGQVPPETDSAATSTMVEALSDIGRHGQKVGAMLAAETGTESGQELARLIARLPPASLGVDLNPANLIVHGHSPRAAVEALAPHVLHVHATDATRDLSVARGIEVPLGQGNAEFPEILAVLEEQQYRGYLTVARRESDSPLADLRQSLAFLRNL